MNNEGMKGIERHEGGGVSIVGADAMATFRLVTMARCLKMEIAGIRMVRHSVYAQVKREFGFKGSKASVLAQLVALTRSKLDEQNATNDDVDAMFAVGGVT